MNDDHLNELVVGARVLYRGRSFRVCGFAPMGVLPQRLWLEDPASGKQIEVAAADVSLPLEKQR